MLISVYKVLTENIPCLKQNKGLHLLQEKIMLKKIDIDGVFKAKNPRLYKILPSSIISFIKKIVHQEEINIFLAKHHSKYGFDFVEAIIHDFKITTKAIGLENLPAQTPCIVASNHPLGSLDAMALLHETGKVRKDIKFLVNDILLNLENLKNIFSGVNKVGKTATQALEEIEKVFAMNIAVFTFPAGLVSRKLYPNGFLSKPVIEDLEWKKSFISRSKRNKKDIIPVYIDGKNSNFFYNLANWRKKIGIQANIEMLFLVDEMYKQRVKTITIIFGEPISYETFDKRHTDSEWAELVRKHVYKMGKKMQPLKFEPGIIS